MLAYWDLETLPVSPLAAQAHMPVFASDGSRGSGDASAQYASILVTKLRFINEAFLARCPSPPHLSPFSLCPSYNFFYQFIQTI
jgi:hypothetical protein